MSFNDLVYWYQKKIGTYDKQQWEKTVEQRIFGGFTNVPMRTAKLKTELIDVDLVRGSSFPKAKPKHGLSTVAWLATQRLVLLPLHRIWWIQQTSQRIFTLFLLLYCLQLFNMCIYFSFAETDQTNMVSSAEVLMPVGMMFILCMVHSQIVSTNSGPTTITGHNRSRVRRSRHGRCRSGKLRSRRHLRSSNDAKSNHESVTEKVSKVSCEVPPSVRFAKKVSIENSTTLGKVQLEVKPGLVLNEKPSKNRSPMSTPDLAIPVVVFPVVEEPSDDVAGENSPNANIVHQDDDGFESLNGNVSSDNDRGIARPAARNSSKKTNETANCANFEEQRSRVVQVAEPENARDSRPAVSDVPKKVDNNSDREEEPCDHPGKEQVPKIVNRDGKQQCESEEEGECEEAATNHLTEATTSATEWMGVTTNSDVCSYSSDLEESDPHSETNVNYTDFAEHPFSWELELPPSILLSSSCTSSDRVSCTIWTRRDIKKAELSVLDISSAIIAQVESMPEGMNYFYGGLVLSIILTLVPSMRRLSDEFGTESSQNLTGSPIVSDVAQIIFESWSVCLCKFVDVAFGATLWERTIVLILAFEKLTLSCLLFFLLAVAERTFKQRLLYAKLFSHLTSSRRARKSDLPHFRLNKVRNIKTWLSVRSYLKRRGPQRSVDVIVSAVFIVTLLLLSFVSLELIKDLESLHSQYNVEALLWSFALGIYILRFMTLGTKINKKYRSLSVLITEQINLYLQIEQKPHKKDELMVANSVLKLAADLIKELECPFKISGLSANPYLYTITKVVLLSALSGVLSELLGFKLKLHKITIK